jgi:hypothetical protein
LDDREIKIAQMFIKIRGSAMPGKKITDLRRIVHKENDKTLVLSESLLTSGFNYAIM